MKRNYFKMLVLILISVTGIRNESFAIECVPTPDCTTLGYTKTESECTGANLVLKCPFNDSKVACSAVTVTYEPKVGYILYSDKTFSPNVEAGKTPIGVIFDEENRLAVALTDVKKDGSAGSEVMSWSSSSSSYCDTPGLENCKKSNTLITTCGLDGRANTDTILASTCNGTTYAANAVNSYQVSGCSKDFCRQGK